MFLMRQLMLVPPHLSELDEAARWSRCGSNQARELNRVQSMQVVRLGEIIRLQKVKGKKNRI